MIEIGRDSRISAAFRRAATTLGSLSMLIGFIWLIRQLVGLEQYSLTLLLVGFGLFFLDRLLRTETNSGPGRALLSLLWNMTAVFIGITVTIWIFGWIASLQSDIFPATLSRWVPDIVIGAIITGLGAYALQKSGLAKRTMAPFIVGEGRGPTIQGTKLVV